MRKLLFAALAATALAPAAASAQSAREVRHDQHEVAKDKREVRHDLAKGKVQEAREDAQETRRDQNETNRDWQDYRRTHRNVFTRPAYVPPRGYSYRPLSVGAMLNRMFWGSQQYRINDYSTYRLPYPGPNRMYVRYGNDVLLVDARTGRVIQVYSSFFY